MKLSFSKYVATGNDFVVVDNRDGLFDANDKKFWEKVCAQKWGVGADGVLLVEKSLKGNCDFKMRYLNADGGEVSMCGNGARAITAFFHHECNGGKSQYTFETKNGVYNCKLDSLWGYCLSMTELYDVGKIDISNLTPNLSSLYLNTGVPHCVFEVKGIDHYPVFEEGRKIRYNSLFNEGTNANFYTRLSENRLKVRTYERGVENETLACGTGATAVAIQAAKKYQIKDSVEIEVPGGLLLIKFNEDFSAIELCGKAEKIFSGTLNFN